LYIISSESIDISNISTSSQGIGPIRIINDSTRFGPITHKSGISMILNDEREMDYTAWLSSFIGGLAISGKKSKLPNTFIDMTIHDVITQF
jgi:hypothetical protein